MPLRPPETSLVVVIDGLILSLSAGLLDDGLLQPSRLSHGYATGNVVIVSAIATSFLHHRA
jgi:hypothetical protein